MEKLNVLVTAVGCPGGPGIVDSLRQVKERELTIYGVDMRNTAPGFRLVDIGKLVPAAENPDYLYAMLSICKENNISFVIPLADPELVILSQNKNLFKKIGTTILLSDPYALQVARFKSETYRILGQAGISVPDYRKPTSYNEFMVFARELGYPKKTLCLKPDASSGTRGFCMLPGDDFDFNLDRKLQGSLITPEIVEKWYAKTQPNIVLMEFLPGDEYSVDLLTKEGRVLASVVRKRVSIRAGISDVGTIEDKPDVAKVCERTVKVLSSDYNINIQTKYDSAGVPKVLEINPRLSGSVVFCTHAGVNLPYLAVKLALGEKLPDMMPKKVTVARYLKDMRIDG